VLTLAERWDGTAWTIQATPNFPGTNSDSQLVSVSCTTASACLAAGFGSGGTLAERWDGTTWTIQTTQNPSKYVNSFSGVSCSSATACTAVGITGGSDQLNHPLIERWDGGTWTVQDPNNPSVASLSGVSCNSATSCAAVGNYGSTTPPRSPFVALAERWDGSTWTIQSVSAPASANASYLTSDSCAPAAPCTAAGHYFNQAGDPQTLAARSH
jgi:hypothetical protein